MSAKTTKPAATKPAMKSAAAPKRGGRALAPVLAVEFNSTQAVNIAAGELDSWATDHLDAAIALKALVRDLVWTRKLVGNKVIVHELERLEV